MLTSLLPGLRDLRAPLAAGYLWLLFGWLILQPHSDEWDTQQGVLAAAKALEESMTPGGVAAAVSFAAYLIGSLSEGLIGSLSRGLIARIPGGVATLLPQVELSEVFSRRYPVAAVNKVYPVVSAWLDQKYAAAQRVNLQPEEARDLIVEELGPPADDQPRAEGFRLGLALRVAGELDVVADNLLDEKSDLFGPVDRLRGEVELRRALAPPLAALALLLAIESSWLYVLLGLVVVAGLLYDARLKSFNRLERIRAALTTKPTRSPTLSRIERSLAARFEQAGVHKWLEDEKAGKQSERARPTSEASVGE